MEGISKESLNRLPAYLRCLKEMDAVGIENVSSTVLAEKFNLNAVTVRKDLACVSEDSGKPKTGFSISELITVISNFLGCNNSQDAVLVGVGKLGSALLSYKGFCDYGLTIVAAFDSKKDILQADKKGEKIFDISKLPSLVKRMKINLGIITVPTENAQEVADLLIESGVRAIWNFAPIHLITPSNVVVKNEDMAASLAILSRQLNEIIQNEE